MSSSTNDWPVCPHCGVQVLMDDPDNYQHHVTYWGDDDKSVASHDCRSCGATIFLKEFVHRWWASGRTPDEAAEL